MKKKIQSSGFKIPEGYFENFESDLYNRIDEKDFPEKSGFTVPENYFDQLPQTVAEAVSKENKTIRLFPGKTLAAVSAVAALLILAFLVFRPEPEIIQFDQLQLSLIDKYIEDGNIRVDIYDLEHYLDEQVLSQFNPLEASFSQEAILDYLWENSDYDLTFEGY